MGGEFGQLGFLAAVRAERPAGRPASRAPKVRHSPCRRRRRPAASTRLPVRRRSTQSAVRIREAWCRLRSTRTRGRASRSVSGARFHTACGPGIRRRRRRPPARTLRRSRGWRGSCRPASAIRSCRVRWGSSRRWRPRSMDRHRRRCRRWPATSRTPLRPSREVPAASDGAGKCSLQPPPVAPQTVSIPSPFQTLSLSQEPDAACRRVPPTATTCGEEAGYPTRPASGEPGTQLR